MGEGAQGKPRDTRNPRWLKTPPKIKREEKMDSAALFQPDSLLNTSPDDVAPTQRGALTSPFPESVFQKGTARSWVIRENAETAQNLRGGWPLDGSFFFRRQLSSIALQACDRERDIPILMAAVCPTAFTRAAV